MANSTVNANPRLGGGFLAMERLIAEVRTDARRAGYVLLGDEAFLQQ